VEGGFTTRAFAYHTRHMKYTASSKGNSPGLPKLPS